jgi:hypothetical protein
MQTHRINAPHFVAGVVIDDDGYCIQAAPIIGYCVGKPSTWFFDYCRKKGWTIEPLTDFGLIEFSFRGDTYLVWKDDTRIQRIVVERDGEHEEITWKELPEQLKTLL